MALSRSDSVKAIYQDLWKNLWFQGFIIIYTVALTIFIVYAGVEVHSHRKDIDRVSGRFAYVSGIDIEANQTNACKRCVSNDVIVNPGISMSVDPNTTQFSTGLKTPCHTNTETDAELTQTTRLTISGASPFETVPMRGNLSFAETTGLTIPSFTQNCTTAACLPMNTTFCDESNSPGSIYIHRRINMGTAFNVNLTHYCACILDRDTAVAPLSSTLFCTEPLGIL